MKMNHEAIQMIEKRLHEYEKEYGIDILLWSLRGSVDIGIYRNNSDLDIVFIYRSSNKKLRAIHDIVGHGFDYWGWILEDALLTVDESNRQCKTGKQYVISQEHNRASLTYYFGIYCMLGNLLSYDFGTDSKRCRELLADIYIPQTNVIEFQNKLLPVYEKICMGMSLYGNELLYSVWYTYMCKHIIHGGLPGDNKLKLLLSKYANHEQEKNILMLYGQYKALEGKKTRQYSNPIVNDIIAEQFENNKNYIYSQKFDIHSRYNTSFERLKGLC